MHFEGKDKEFSMKEQSIKKNIIFSTFYQILLLFTPLITTPYISRVLGPTGNGIYSYTNSYQLYFSMFAALGTLSYGQREIARNRDSKYERSKLFWEIEFLTIITSGICILIWLAFSLFQTNYRIYFLILTLNIFATMFDISWFYAGIEQFKFIVMRNSFFKILGVVLQLTMVKNSNDVAVYIFIICITNLLGSISMWFALVNLIERVPVKNLQILRHFKETVIYFIPTIATSIYTVLDKTLIGLITHDESQNGYYEQATKVINLMKALTFASLNSVLGSRISYLFAEERHDEIRERIDTSIDYILFMGIGMSFGLVAVAERFVPIFFGKGYDTVIYLLYIFSPLIIVIGISNCLGSQYYTPAGLRRQSTKYIIVGAIVNLCLNVLLISRFLSMGAAAASLIAECVITFLYLKNGTSFFNPVNLVKKGWRKVLAAMVMLFAISLINRLRLGNIYILILEIALGAIVYVITLFVLRDSLLMKFWNIGMSLIKKIRSK